MKVEKLDDLKTVSNLLNALGMILTQLKPNKKRLNRRLINQAYDNYDKIKQLMLLDDNIIDAKEKQQLEDYKDAIIVASIGLLK